MTEPKNLYIKPSQGVTVRDPVDFQPLAIDGEYKPRTSYWVKRLRDGDVEVIEPPALKPDKKHQEEISK